MNPELLKILNPKTVRLDGAGGGIPTLTISDVNAACAGADQMGLDLLLARVCQSREHQSRAFYRLYLEVVDLAAREHWKIREKGQEKLRSLTQLVLFELTQPLICPKCNGTKYNRNMKPCKSCGGHGYYRIKDSQRAKALDIDPSTWQRVWIHRYSDVLSLILDHESRALRNIGKKLK